MTYSHTLYQPSVLELAQDGNCRALTCWMNSFLSPQGVQVQVLPAPNRFLRILVDFRKPQQKEACLRLRDRLVRFICYRLWTLNSEVIRGVQIVARIAGEPRVLWQLSVRINSPATARLRRAEAANFRQLQAANHFKFRVLRSLFMSSMTLAGFFLGYWLFYVEMGRLLSRDTADTAITDHSADGSVDSSTDSSTGNPGAVAPSGQPRLPAPPHAAVFTVPDAFQGQIVSQVDLPAEEKVIALTFDDGPQTEITEQVLEVLKQYSVQATFFVTGENIRQLPTLAKRIVAEGHAIGNRGWHRSLENGKAVNAAREIDDTTKLIRQITGAKTALFRPAEGRLDNELVSYAQSQQYAIALWSVDSQDTLMAAPLVLDNVLRNARSGRIILMHDGKLGSTPSTTVQVLPQLIAALQQQGYRFVTVPELLELQNAKRQKENTTLPLRKRAVAVAQAAALPAD